jgi:hypothetical protein
MKYMNLFSNGENHKLSEEMALSRGTNGETVIPKLFYIYCPKGRREETGRPMKRWKDHSRKSLLQSEQTNISNP